jgi:uroporphyrinogen decarboxylase
MDRDNALRAARFERPDSIPTRMVISNACWRHYPTGALEDLMAEHKRLFPGFERQPEPTKPTYAPWRVAGHPHTDSWGCVWKTVEDGITGTVVTRALPTWEALEGYVPPNPDCQNGWGALDWATEANRIQQARMQGHLAQGSLRHGHTFLTMTYMRGYEDLLFDMADADPHLPRLIAMVEAFNRRLVDRYLDLDVDWLGYPEDLGMQRGPMLSPAQFRAYIKPTYQRLMAPAREAGCVVHMHSDGDIRALVVDLLDCGVDVLNIQDLVNGVDWLAGHLAGRVCIDLDIDRQHITRFGTPDEIDAHVLQVVQTLGCREGGLMLTHDLMPGIPLENARALMDAMERYAGFYSG